MMDFFIILFNYDFVVFIQTFIHIFFALIKYIYNPLLRSLSCVSAKLPFSEYYDRAIYL